MDQSDSEDLEKITEIMEKIKKRTEYQDTKREEDYKTEYNKVVKIDKNSDYSGHNNDGNRSSRVENFEYEKFEIIKGENTREENVEFLNFLIKEAMPTIQNIDKKIIEKADKVLSKAHRDTANIVQKLYTAFTGNDNEADITRDYNKKEYDRLYAVSRNLSSIKKLIEKLIRVYQTGNNGGKYKTRRNINKKYKKSVKKYKKSYRRR